MMPEYVRHVMLMLMGKIVDVSVQLPRSRWTASFLVELVRHRSECPHRLTSLLATMVLHHFLPLPV